MVRQLFNQREAGIILKTPISFLNSKDKLLWQGTKDDSFSVRSAYHKEIERTHFQSSQASSSSSFTAVWKQLWQLKVQPGVLLWRSCLEALPTNSNLYKRRLVENPLCPICYLEAEDSAHALWRCESAKDVWSQCSKSLQKCHQPHVTMIQLLEDLLQAMDSRIIQEFAVVARKIWWRRNKFLFEGTFAHPNAVVREARGTLDLLIEEESRLGRGQTNTQVEDWQAPPSNWIKLNWDSAVDKANGVIGVGVAVRDSLGYTIATKKTNKLLFPNPLLAKAFGALKAVQFGVELGLSQVVVEGDSLQVINILRSDKEGCNS
ncbi:hypothetical protein F2P56_036930, partial [Juglans regia]|uniref:Uncharacterized protein LOC109021081 n=2 Tax=Juglans regia TaxID=51240 RepID=A0A2I4HSP0_JUGRE